MMNTVRKSENLLPFPVISAAANGDTTAMCAILKHYEGSDWIFFVILEAVFVVLSFSLLNSTCGYPSTAYLFTASQVLCHYSHWNKEWLLPSREGIPIHHITGLQPPPCSQLSTFRYSYLCIIPLTLPFRPVCLMVPVTP